MKGYRIAERIKNLVYANSKLNRIFLNVYENLQSVRRLTGFSRAEKTYRCVKKNRK